jgi:hypothetical protein
MAVASDDVEWVRGFRVAEKYGVVDRFADEVTEVCVTPDGCVHTGFCRKSMATVPTLLPLPEAVRLLGSSPVCDVCFELTTLQQGSLAASLDVLEAVVCDAEPVSDWFAPATVKLRERLRELAGDPEVLARVAGSLLGELWAAVPDRFVEHRERLRSQALAYASIVWAAPLMRAHDLSGSWQGDDLWRPEPRSGLLAKGARVFHLSPLSLVDSVTSLDPSTDAVAALLRSAAAHAARHGVSVPDAALEAALEMAADAFVSDVVWMVTERDLVADVAMLWPSASAGPFTVIAAPGAISARAFRSATVRCAQVPERLWVPEVSVLQIAARLVADVGSSDVVSGEQWEDVVGTVSALT